jgi:hypothetical protein
VSFPVFIEAGDRRFDGNRSITPKPALILTGKTFRTPLSAELGIPAKDRLAVFKHQDPPSIFFTGIHANVGSATQAFILVNNHLNGSLFETHSFTPPLTRVPGDIP